MSTIKPKYNIGDTVWYVDSQRESPRPMSTRVLGVLQPYGDMYEYSLASLERYTFMFEDFIFATRDEAIAHVGIAVKSELEKSLAYHKKEVAKIKSALTNLDANLESMGESH